MEYEYLPAIVIDPLPTPTDNFKTGYKTGLLTPELIGGRKSTGDTD